MQQTPRRLLSARTKEYERALESFETLLAVNLSPFGDVVRDGLRNGQIQKFEYCAELMWKVARAFLLEEKGIKASSPRDAIKEIYRVTDVSDEDFERMQIVIDDRNSLSHLYREELFEDVHSRLPEHVAVMKRLLRMVKPSIDR